MHSAAISRQDTLNSKESLELESQLMEQNQSYSQQGFTQNQNCNTLKILRRKLFLRNKIKKEQVEDKRFDKDYKFASSAVSVQYIDPNFVS